MVKNIENKIKDYLKNQKNLIAAYLFGSFASGKYTIKSDIDIALLFDVPTNKNIDRLSIMTDLSRIAGRDVDIIIVNNISPRLFHEVLINHVILIDKNPIKRIKHEVLNKKLYEDYRHLHSIYMKGLVKRYGKQKHR